jgi:hypothetical protein
MLIQIYAFCTNQKIECSKPKSNDLTLDRCANGRRPSEQRQSELGLVLKGANELIKVRTG